MNNGLSLLEQPLIEQPWKIPPGATPYHIPFFFETIALGTTAAPTDTTLQRQIGDEDFYWIGLGSNSATRTTAIRVVEDRTGRNFMGASYVSLTKIIPYSDRFDFLWTGLRPYRMKAGGSVTLEVRNTSAAVSRLGVTLYGYRLPKRTAVPRDADRYPPYFISQNLTAVATTGLVRTASPTPRVGDLPYRLVAIGFDFPDTNAPLFAFYGPKGEEYMKPRVLVSSLSLANASTGYEPVYPLLSPVEYPAGSGIKTEIESTGTSEALNLVYIGYQDRGPQP